MFRQMDNETSSFDSCKGQRSLNSSTGVLFLYCKITLRTDVPSQRTGKSHLNKSVVIAFCFQECLWILWDSTPHILKGEASWGRRAEMLPGPASTIRHSVQLHMPTHRPVFLGACGVAEVNTEFWGIGFSWVPLEYGIKNVQHQRQRLFTSWKPRVNLVHLRLSSRRRGNVPVCKTKQPPPFSPWESLNLCAHFSSSCCHINPVYFSHHGHLPRLLSKMIWRGNRVDASTFDKGLWQCWERQNQHWAWAGMSLRWEGKLLSDGLSVHQGPA